VAPPAWTRPADIREAVRKKWGILLADYAAGQEWTPRSFPLRGPGPAEIGERLGEVQKWAGEWEQAAARGPLRVEYKRVGGRHIGVNLILAGPGSMVTSRPGRCSAPPARSAA
jgi:hypothetical protein